MLAQRASEMPKPQCCAGVRSTGTMAEVLLCSVKKNGKPRLDGDWVAINTLSKANKVRRVRACTNGV